MINKLELWYHVLIGDRQAAPSMQSRIFHQVCIVVLLFIPFGILLNIHTKIPNVTPILAGAFILTACLFYNSRILGNLRISSILFVLVLNALMIGNYFLNSGIQGPTMMLFILALVFTIAVIPKRKYLIWIPINIIIVSGLLLCEFLYPETVVHSYTSRAGVFSDNGFTYLVVVCCIVIVLVYILRSYRKEKDNVEQASAALKEANDSKTKLLSILSHDLKTPLNSIQGFLELLIEYDLDEKEEKVLKKSLLKEVKNTQTLLFNLLSWTKTQMEEGVKVNLVKVELYPALTDSLKIHQTAAMEKMINLEIQIEPALCVLADLEMLKLVVRNLVSNAIKFTGSGGAVSVVTSRARDRVTIAVKDNGIGMSADKIDRVFSLGTGITYGTNHEKGVGLGLVLCKEFAEMQGGEITVSSEEGKGSTFELSLPICKEDYEKSMQSSRRPVIETNI